MDLTTSQPGPSRKAAYLSDLSLKVHLSSLRKNPYEYPAQHTLYNRLVETLFPETSGFAFSQKSLPDSDVEILTIQRLSEPDGREQILLVGMTDVVGLEESWQSYEKMLREGHKALDDGTSVDGMSNRSDNEYAMLLIGLEMQFYRVHGGIWDKLGPKMHVVNDADEVEQVAKGIKDHM